MSVIRTGIFISFSFTTKRLTASRIVTFTRWMKSIFPENSENQLDTKLLTMKLKKFSTALSSSSSTWNCFQASWFVSTSCLGHFVTPQTSQPLGLSSVYRQKKIYRCKIASDELNISLWFFFYNLLTEFLEINSFFKIVSLADNTSWCFIDKSVAEIPATNDKIILNPSV